MALGRETHARAKARSRACKGALPGTPTSPTRVSFFRPRPLPMPSLGLAAANFPCGRLAATQDYEDEMTKRPRTDQEETWWHKLVHRNVDFRPSTVYRAMSEEKGAGTGLFANKFIPKGEVVCWYAGALVPMEMMEAGTRSHALHCLVSTDGILHSAMCCDGRPVAWNNDVPPFLGGALMNSTVDSNDNWNRGMSNVTVHNGDIAFIDVRCYVNGRPLGYVAYVVTASKDIRPREELKWPYYWSRQNTNLAPIPVEDIAKKQNAKDEERKRKTKKRIEPVAVAPSVGEPSGRQVPVAVLVKALDWADMADDFTRSEEDAMRSEEDVMRSEEDVEVPVQTLVERAEAALAAARSGA